MYALNRIRFCTLVLMCLMTGSGHAVLGENPLLAQLAIGQSTDQADETGASVAGRTMEGWGDDLQSQDRIIRLRAAKSLVAFGQPAGPMLATLLDDDDAAIRYVAAVGLGDIGGEPLSAATKTLQRITKSDSSQAVSMATAYALCRNREQDSDNIRIYLPTLINRLDHPERGMVCSASELIGKIGPRAGAAAEKLQAVFEANQPGGKGDYHKGGAAKNALRKIQ